MHVVRTYDHCLVLCYCSRSRSKSPARMRDRMRKHAARSRSRSPENKKDEEDQRASKRISIRYLWENVFRPMAAMAVSNVALDKLWQDVPLATQRNCVEDQLG
jgi:hypothetical protein